jgi:hypothetical protein
MWVVGICCVSENVMKWFAKNSTRDVSFAFFWVEKNTWRVLTYRSTEMHLTRKYSDHHKQQKCHNYATMFLVHCNWNTISYIPLSELWNTTSSNLWFGFFPYLGLKGLAEVRRYIFFSTKWIYFSGNKLHVIPKLGNKLYVLKAIIW